MKGHLLIAATLGALTGCLSPLHAAETPAPDASDAVVSPAPAVVAPAALPNLNLTALLKEQQLTDGPWAGAFRSMQGDDRLNWHTCNLALYPLVSLNNYGLIRTYLNQYLNHVDAKTGTIQDFNVATSQAMPSDSDDACAGSFLSLAVRYRQLTNNRAWWNKNVWFMKKMARQVLLGTQKKSGLVRARAVESQGSQAYLMNNCEVYRGLKDFSNTLREEKDPDAAQFGKAAAQVAAGIATLFDEETQSFHISDAPPWPPTFNPDRVAQVFPQLYGVPLGSPAETQLKYDAAWKYLNANGDSWESGTLIDGNDKSLGGYPWMLLSTVATKRSDAARVNKQLEYYLGQLSQTPVPAPMTAIHELGFALRTQGSPAQVIAHGSVEDQLPDDAPSPR